MRIGEVLRNQRVLSTVVRAYVCMHKAFCTAASQGEAFDQHIASRLTVTRSGARGPGSGVAGMAAFTWSGHLGADPERFLWVGLCWCGKLEGGDGSWRSA